MMKNEAFLQAKKQSGFAMVTVLVALALVTTIGVALTGMGVVQYRTSVNHRSATRAVLMADAGATHVLALMRGPLAGLEYSQILAGDDGIWDTADDGILTGFGLSAYDEVPDTGMAVAYGRYSVRIVNDPGDPSGDPAVDSNNQMIAICSGQTLDGGVAEIRALLDASAFPAIATNGDLDLPGNPDILGPCAGVHANGSLTVSGNPTVDGDVTATGDVLGSGTITDPDGYEVIPRSDEPPIEVTEYDPMDYCGAADYVLRDGWIITVGPPRDSALAGSGPAALGWDWDPGDNEYQLGGNDAEPGTICAYGNVKISGNPGEKGSPAVMTILAQGSVQVSGNPRLRAAHADDILIMATGDVVISGNPYASGDNYSGMIYAGSQCMLNGNPKLDGNLLCYDAPGPSGALDLIDENKVNGNPTITYDCTGIRKRTSIAAWWETRTS